MSQIIEKILRDVSLDERISDGIFQLENVDHMDALRDYFVKHGLTQEAAIHVTNRMTEGRFPERQAYRTEDGILVTWPSTALRNKKMHEEPGKYTLQKPLNAPKPAKPEPPEKKEPAEKEIPEEPAGDEDVPTKPSPNLFGGGGGGGSKIQQGDKELEIEPPMGMDTEAPKTSPAPAAPTPPPAPRTPERVAAEKEVVKQIMATDDHALANITPPMSEECKRQLHELYNKADQLGFCEAITFLTPFVKP